MSVHPSKNCIAAQTSDTELTLLFVKKQECDQIGFKYTKSSKILLHSFCFGDDFNFMVVTNNIITLYNLNLALHTQTTVEKIPIPYIDSIACAHFEPMASTLVLVDKSGQTVVFFLNMHATKFKSNKTLLTQQFYLDIALKDEDEEEEGEKNLVDKMKSYFQN